MVTMSLKKAEVMIIHNIIFDAVKKSKSPTEQGSLSMVLEKFDSFIDIWRLPSGEFTTEVREKPRKPTKKGRVRVKK